MSTELKAVVFGTSKLKETKDFFVTKLGFLIKESSVTHFVIYSKGIRILFVEPGNDLEVELYVCKVLIPSGKKNLTLYSSYKEPELTICEEPNGIKIIISNYNNKELK